MGDCMKIYVSPMGPIEANCTLIVDENSGESAIFDVGEYGERLEKLLSNIDISKLKYIILTHRHYDHLLGVAELKKHCNARILISEKDACGLTDGVASLAAKHGIPQQYTDDFGTLSDGDSVKFGDICLKAMSTPGHTVGSMCFICDAEKVIIAGDTVFYTSCGRTDLPSGSSDDMLKSLHRLSQLDGDYDIICGHGQATSLNFERSYNAYMR